MRTDIRENVIVIVENHGCEPVVMDAGEIIGHVTPAAECGEVDNGYVMSISASDFEEIQLKQLRECVMLNSRNLEELQARQLATLIDEFADVFALELSELGATELVTHSIDTGEAPPIKQPARRIPFTLRGTVDEMVGEMLKQGVIEPSQSPWSSPVVLVEKKDGTKRFCEGSILLQSLMSFPCQGMVYINDVLVVGKTFEEHLTNLKEVFTRLRQAGLRLKPNKCLFRGDQVVYLGYVVSREGISPDPQKVEAVKCFPYPQDIKTLRSFLGSILLSPVCAWIFRHCKSSFCFYKEGCYL